MERKKALRLEMKRCLKHLDSKCENETKLSQLLLQWLKSNNFYSKEMVLGAFAPILGEEPNFLISFSEIENRTLAFPAINSDGEMIFRKSHPKDLMVTKEFGVELKTPDAQSLEVTPNFLLVPGLAFNLFGERLGRGKGFYDRYLEKFVGVKIGICFESQLVKEIPTEVHDQRCDWLITEKNIYNCLK